LKVCLLHLLQSKDELEKQIETLKNTVRDTKSEIERLMMAQSVFENENVSLKQVHNLICVCWFWRCEFVFTLTESNIITVCDPLEMRRLREEVEYESRLLE
jgi:hypothetical protein